MNATELQQLKALAQGALNHGDAIGEDEWYSAYENMGIFAPNPDLSFIAAANPSAILGLIELAERASLPGDEGKVESIDTVEFWNYVIAYTKGSGHEGVDLVMHIDAKLAKARDDGYECGFVEGQSKTDVIRWKWNSERQIAEKATTDVSDLRGQLRQQGNALEAMRERAEKAEAALAARQAPDPRDVSVDRTLLKAACDEIRKYATPAGADDQVVLNLESALLSKTAQPLQQEGGKEVPAGYAIVPDYRGYAHLGFGQYLLDNTVKPAQAELVISVAKEHEKVGKVVGGLYLNAPDTVVQPEDMAVRIRFGNVAGLDALEQQLRLLRDEHFPESQPPDNLQQASTAQVAPAKAWKCSFCGSSSSYVCDDVGCHGHEAGEEAASATDTTDFQKIALRNGNWGALETASTTDAEQGNQSTKFMRVGNSIATKPDRVIVATAITSAWADSVFGALTRTTDDGQAIRGPLRDCDRQDCMAFACTLGIKREDAEAVIRMASCKGYVNGFKDNTPAQATPEPDATLVVSVPGFDVNAAWDAIGTYVHASMSYHETHLPASTLEPRRKAFDEAQASLKAIIGARTDNEVKTS